MNLNDIVFVRPTASMKFARRWGFVAEITEDWLPIKVLFSGSDIPYGFLRTDLLDLESYFKWFELNKVAYLIEKDHIGTVTKLEYPFVWLDDERHFLTNLLPITECVDCFTEYVGNFQTICDACHYGGEF